MSKKISKALELEIIQEIEEYSVDETDIYISRFTSGLRETMASSGLNDEHVAGFVSGYLACIDRNKIITK